MNKQSTLLYVLLMSFLMSNCQKSKSVKEELYANTPATAIPAAFKEGIWFWGNLGPIAFFDRDGHQVGNETEAARQYTFTEVDGKGRVEFMQYLGLRNASNCVTEIYTTKKGTIAFEGTDKFTFYPVEGNFRTIKKGCSNNGTQNREATGNDLTPEPYLWEVKMFDNKKLLYIYNAVDINKQDPVFVYQYVK
ncbi:MAG: hypothetical protein J7578_18465 [Chitinophagaceae bacterium]|nr:hypothetical protein [Chitinophagaceae bacterium]